MQIFQKVKSGGMSICVSCAHRKVCKGIDNQPCVECNQFFNEDKQPKTNADRIRAMSDEELAKLIYEADSLGYCKNLMECVKEEALGDAIPDERCIACALAWLRQPVEDAG